MSLKASIVAIALALGLAACGSGSDNAQPTTEPSQVSSTIKEETWDRLVKRAQECAPKDQLYVEMSSTRPTQVAVVSITSSDALQYIAVRPAYTDDVLEFWPTGAYYTPDTRMDVKYTTRIGDSASYDGSEDEVEERARIAAYQIKFEHMLNEKGCRP